MLTRRRLLIATALAGLPAAALASRPDRLLVAYHDQQDDLWHTDAAGATAGVATEILKEIVERRAGLGLDYVGLPWLRAQDIVRTGTADALFTIPTAARREYLVFTPSPLVRYPLAIIYLADGPATAALDRAATVDDLRHFCYIYDQFDTTQTARAQRFPAAEASPGDLPMMRQVAGGRGDFTVANLIRIRRALGARGLAGRLKARAFPALGQVEHHFGLRRTYPDAACVIDRIEAAGVAANAEGLIQAILDQYM